MDTTTQPAIGIKPLLSLKRHYHAAVAAMIVVLLVGLPVVWIKGQSYYAAEAVFQVAPSYMKNLEADKELELQSNSQYREYVNHLATSVKRFDVLERAVADLKGRGIDPRPASLSERKYIEQLQRTIYVRAIPDTYMVRIGTESPEKAHLDALVNAITDSFLKTVRTEQIYGSGDRLKVLQETAARLRAEVEQLEAERVVLAEKLGLTTFSETAKSPFDGMLEQAREKLTAATIERLQAEAALSSFDRQREVPSTYAGRSLLEMRLLDNGLQALRNEVVKRTEELNRTLAGLEPKHPARQAATAELAEINQRLKAAEAEFDRVTHENFRTRLVASLSQRVQVEKDVQATVVKVEGVASDFARNFQQAMRLTNEIKKREADLTRLRERLNYLETESQALGFVRLVSAALPAETPMGMGKTKLLLALVAAAVAFGLALPIVLDLFGRNVRSVNEAEKLMGFPAAGWQVRVEDLSTQIFAEEQARRFASALMRNRARGERRTFAFTAVKPGGGVTTVILDTARVLSQLGARVLVVEANAFAPFPGLDTPEPGLSDFLAGKAELAALPRPFAYREGTLEVVGIGSEREGGLKRLDLLVQAVAEWSARYDYVLFDLPPILLSADAEMLIDALGQVFLVIEAEAVTAGEIGRAKRLLQKLDPEAVGLFVNRVPVFRGGGYMEGLMAETLTRTRFERFMSLAQWRLWWEMLRVKWSSRRAGRDG